MAWDEWDQLPPGDGPGPATSGVTRGLVSSKKAWNKAGEDVGGLGPEGSGPTATTGASGHSEYWDRGTTALKNQALVVVGEYIHVTTPE